MGSNYQDLHVGQESMDLAEQIYRVTDKFPKREWYGLTQQVRRAAISVASNIAEGKGRSTDRDFLRFLFTARGSLFEVETQVKLAERLQFLGDAEAEPILTSISAIARKLTGLINSLSMEATGQTVAAVRP
jgi:four helix bundle protein